MATRLVAVVLLAGSALASSCFASPQEEAAEAEGSSDELCSQISAATVAEVTGLDIVETSTNYSYDFHECLYIDSESPQVGVEEPADANLTAWSLREPEIVNMTDPELQWGTDNVSRDPRLGEDGWVLFVGPGWWAYGWAPGADLVLAAFTPVSGETAVELWTVAYDALVGFATS